MQSMDSFFFSIGYALYLLYNQPLSWTVAYISLLAINSLLNCDLLLQLIYYNQ